MAGTLRLRHHGPCRPFSRRAAPYTRCLAPCASWRAAGVGLHQRNLAFMFGHLSLCRIAGMCSNYEAVSRADRLLTFFGVVRGRDDPTATVFPTGLAPFIRLAEDGSGNRLVDDGAF